MENFTTSKTISEENTFTDPVAIAPGYASFSLSGTWVGTVHLQRSFDDGSTWLDVNSYTSNTEATITEGAAALYRAGIKTGNYTSGSAICLIAQWRHGKSWG